MVFTRLWWYNVEIVDYHYDIVRRRRDVSGDTALRLARATNTTPEFWLDLQSLYNLETAKDALGDRLQPDVTPLAEAIAG